MARCQGDLTSQRLVLRQRDTRENLRCCKMECGRNRQQTEKLAYFQGMILGRCILNTNASSMFEGAACKGNRPWHADT